MQFKLISTRTARDQVKDVAKDMFGDDTSVEIVGDDAVFEITIYEICMGYPGGVP
jgi:hypothetical protein